MALGPGWTLSCIRMEGSRPASNPLFTNYYYISFMQISYSPSRDVNNIAVEMSIKYQMAKFMWHPELANKLIATGDAELTYNNECDDRY